MVDNPPHIEALLEANKGFAKTWEKPLEMTQMRQGARMSGQATIILTCLDPRCVPEEIFAAKLPLRAAVVRNAGGRATKDVVRSAVVLRWLADIKNIIVLHHTDCGMTHGTDEEIAAEALDRTPEAAEEIKDISYGCFTAEEFEETIKKDVLTLRASPSLKGVSIWGMALDTMTGIVTTVDI